MATDVATNGQGDKLLEVDNLKMYFPITQGIILQRRVKRPKIANSERRLLVLLASRLRAWRSALLVVKPETLLQWHRDLFKLVWRHKSAVKMGRPRLAKEVIALIKQMAKDNPLWG